ncbi:MAG TPA: molybdenum cofactor biosynthesis protein MoaE [Phycisphaerae bacterium]|nr:molybdenum cofactor biosynthesis protein MoaE [Phycisphaerae bacterium]
MSIRTADWVALVDRPIDQAAVRRRLDAAPADARGGVCIFEGCTRSERHPEHGSLLRLDYEAYDDMALRQMNALADEAHQRWPLGAIALIHRTGSVAVGEPSVLIGVASAHRAEAFAACRWLIDTLKRDVTIWKREVWSDGASTWSDPTAAPKG